MSEFGKSDQNFLRTFNRKKVMDIFRAGGTVSRIELAELAKLDKKTITNIVTEFIEEGKIRRGDFAPSGVGRPKEMLTLNGTYARCIGFDIGGSHITGILLDFAGDVLASEAVELDLRKEFEFESFVSLCSLIADNLVLKAGISFTDICGIGIAIPGHCDRENGTVLVENIPCLAKADIRAVFEKQYGKPIYIDDCSQLMALAEMRLGEGKKSEDFVVFDLGLGIGCGIVIGQRIFTGAGGKSGEIGHTIVKPDGPRCSCGRYGCIEALASGWALSAQAEEYVMRAPESILARLSKTNQSRLSMKEIVRAADLGDVGCLQMLSDAGVYIGIGVSNAMSLLNPSKIILGGRLIQQNPYLMKSILKTIRENTIDAILRDCKISISRLGAEASALGAALQCLESSYQ